MGEASFSLFCTMYNFVPQGGNDVLQRAESPKGLVNMEEIQCSGFTLELLLCALGPVPYSLPFPSRETQASGTLRSQQKPPTFTS